MDSRERAIGTARTLTPSQLPAPSASLDLLGSFELQLNARVVQLPMTARRLLAFLALRNRPLAREHVAQSLWLDATDRHADGNLRSALWTVARTSRKLIDIAGKQLALSPGVQVDLLQSMELAERLTDSLPTLAVSVLDRDMFDNDVLPDWYDDWVVVERERFRQIRLHALETLCGRFIALGSFGDAVQAGLSAVAGEPLRETANLILMHAYLAEGNPSEAVRQYQSFQDLLESELGISPSESMMRLVTSLTNR